MTFSFLILMAILGLLIGSFLNVVIHRGPGIWKLVDDPARRGNIAFPASYCPACKGPIKVRHNLPLISYLLLGGKCAACKSKIPIRYPLVELLGGMAALAAFGAFGASLDGLFAAGLFFTLIALATIDWETGYLPDALTLPLIIFGVLANIGDRYVTLLASLIGAAAGYLVFRAIGYAYQRLRGQDGLGQGDAKLLAAIGAWAGWTALAPTVLIAALLGLIAVAVIHLRGGKIASDTPIPFGPALAAAGAIVFILIGNNNLPFSLGAL